MLNDRVSVRIPNKADYISLIRLISSAIGSKVGYNIDEIDDLKVAMGEACIISFDPEDKDEVEISFEILKDKLESEVVPLSENLFVSKKTSVVFVLLLVLYKTDCACKPSFL